MELKSLDQYSKRELLELIVSNQVRSEQRLYKIYAFMTEKYGAEFSKHNKHKGETLEDFLSSFTGLGRQINEKLSNNED
jgi:hypothetical protein